MSHMPENGIQYSSECPLRVQNARGSQPADRKLISQKQTSIGAVPRSETGQLCNGTEL